MKTALIIDGNYLLHKDVFILQGMKTLHSDLQNLMRLDIERLSKLFPFDEMYFVSDSSVGYWRKREFTDYKVDRKTKVDQTIDWQWVYKEYSELQEYVKEQTPLTQLQVNYAEGDDIIAYIVNKNNELGYSNIIVAADSDLHQLLRFDISKKYINIAYNYKFSDERIHVPENHNVFFSEMTRKASSTLFDMNEDDEYIDFLNNLLFKTKTVPVTPEELLFVKLIQGDKKDSVPSVYLKETKPNKETGKTKMMGIGKAGAVTAYKLYKETYNEVIDFDSNDFVEKASEIISYVKKIEDVNVINSIKENIKKNRVLLILTDNYLPQQLLENFNNVIPLTTEKKGFTVSPEIDGFFPEDIKSKPKVEEDSFFTSGVVQIEKEDANDDDELDDFFN